MRKRLKLIFMLAAASVAAVLVFQVYWVYNSYQTGVRNFKASVSNALERSIDQYPLAVNQLPSTLVSQVSRPMIMNSLQGNGAGPITIPEVQVSSANLSSIQLLVSRLLAKTAGQSLNLEVLSQLLSNELKKEQINLKFELVVLKKQKTLPPGQIAAFVDFANDNAVVVARMPQMQQYLLSQNIVPALVSILLILLSAGSLYYMSLVIRQQIQLDGLKNDFINNITHELRTPIAILKSSHESLLNFSDLTDRDKTARHLKINVTILDKLDSNVDRILDITKYEKGIKSLNYELVNIDELILSVIARFSVRDGAAISYRPGLNGKLIKTDHYIIDSVLSNLIDNALKYSGEDVSVTVSTELIKGKWQFKVTDNGIGINKANLPYIFEKFYRVTTGNIHDVKGYGLGLSYVKQLITNMDGVITVESKLGQGTEFTINLPADE